jgi:hypothetical protein
LELRILYNRVGKPYLHIFFRIHLIGNCELLVGLVLFRHPAKRILEIMGAGPTISSSRTHPHKGSIYAMSIAFRTSSPYGYYPYYCITEKPTQLMTKLGTGYYLFSKVKRSSRKILTHRSYLLISNDYVLKPIPVQLQLVPRWHARLTIKRNIHLIFLEKDSFFDTLQHTTHPLHLS